jgi:hypothetical protein
MIVIGSDNSGLVSTANIQGLSRTTGDNETPARWEGVVGNYDAAGVTGSHLLDSFAGEPGSPIYNPNDPPGSPTNPNETNQDDPVRDLANGRWMCIQWALGGGSEFVQIWQGRQDEPRDCPAF